ncbi:hypothetical protein GPALN_013034 [Globodera pallida]|uniref:Stathmin n=1 Tax=Globodera pallida TaxID=36090 RepID=A0A183BZI5_GLOPA|nr:hypothetical protein GPALN_013034 [Globodera pallida]
MDTPKENALPRSRSPYNLRLRPENATVAKMFELTEQLHQSEMARAKQLEEEHQLQNEVLELAPRVMKQYLDSRFERLKNAKLEFPRTSDSDSNSLELEKVKKSLRRLKLKAAKEEEQQKKELEESKRREMELERRVSRKLEILKALEEM